MNKKFLLIIIIAVIATLGLLFFLRASQSQDGPDDFSADEKNPIFGGSGNRNEDGLAGEESVEEKSEFGLGGGKNLPRLRKITFKEISGFGLFGNKGTTTIRFVDKESGNVFETNTKTSETKRITNTTILRTVNSWWFDESRFLLRYVDEENNIQTFSAEIQKEAEDGALPLSGVFLDSGIKSLSVFGQNVFHLEEGGGSRGIVSSYGTLNKNVVLETPLEEIIPIFYAQNSLAVGTKPSYLSAGFIFLLNTSTGNLEKLLGGERGFYGNILNEKGDVLFSLGKNTGVSLWFWEREKNKSLKLSKETLVEKCAWREEEKSLYCAVPEDTGFIGLPDIWYKGLVSFSDSLWKINVETNESKLLSDLNLESGERVDALEIRLDEGGENLFFVNKKDGTLWSLVLEKKEVEAFGASNRGIPESE
ncbi:hypothetical protein COV42_02000 [Candidatus Campbellbacteria bacterium CG11_big_fil_rev_8_21_14_0_20_44_21]|uniref:Uncharacterized protein n=1 Tax=Candidatus Campbellbacteria bacterium CG22_combo_CG10-13_8_21_14_all_43_18 TaxID=1974530 RepID=A0A2H0DVZ8_9BACT|nr:MAG: hypothetical protein COW82_02535 [Candidatus Campbellbacteria bacterium CG22_combo_CG10-13_8_21_14_all_43_18]PIR24200.1 MAG: hypothetical protein COV42_02000 [Candidatus Campbellbacteria bacterium CG11_big_fil_rev_8_21_14_0_20_44_21]